MGSVNWSDVERDFEWDGSLRDIYVFDTTLDDWQRMLERIRQGPHPYCFTVDSETCSMPPEAARIFALRNEACVCLSLTCAGMVLNCHFFGEEQIEFDLDPREVNADRWPALLGFLASLGELLGRDVVLTPENFPEGPIVRYDFRRQSAEYVP